MTLVGSGTSAIQCYNSHETVRLTGEEQGLVLQNGAITLDGPGTSSIERGNSQETVPLTGEEQGLELQNGAIILAGPVTSMKKRNSSHETVPLTGEELQNGAITHRPSTSSIQRNHMRLFL
jgi:hypothetical protein